MQNRALAAYLLKITKNWNRRRVEVSVFSLQISGKLRSLQGTELSEIVVIFFIRIV